MINFPKALLISMSLYLTTTGLVVSSQQHNHVTASPRVGVSVPCMIKAPRYTHGTSVLDFVQHDQNNPKTIYLLESMSEQYIPEALYVMGILYLNGCYNNGVRNPREGTSYFAKAAAQRYVPAIAALADSFLVGDGAQKNEREAFKLYKQAADLGNGSAQFNVAVLYRDGIGTKKSKKQAIRYFKMASKNKMLEELQEDARTAYESLQ